MDEDVAQKARNASRRLRRPLKKIINQALRLGIKSLDQPERGRPYHTKARPLGLRKPYQLDNIQELIVQLEGESTH